MDYKYLLYVEKGPVATVTFNRPEKLNAIHRETWFELRACFRAIAANDQLRAVIVTGSGEKAFVAGADIAELAELSPTEARDLSALGQAVLDEIAATPRPVIAAVNGYALGGGLEVALACHMRIASEKAKLGLPEVSLGVIPGYAGTQRLPRLVGEGRALELITSGDPVDAAEALRIGLVNRVVAPDELLPACERLAGRIAQRGPLAVQHALTAVRHGLQGSLAEGALLEQNLFGLLWSTADMREGTGAFLEKRKPDFQGR